MHAWLNVLAVLITVITIPLAGLRVTTVVGATAAAAAAADSTTTTSTTTTNTVNAAIDPVALASYEKDLFAQLGLTKRPKIIDRDSIVIPAELMDIYKKMMSGHEHSDSLALPTPGQHTKSANTIRSYGHEGSSIDDKFTQHHKFRLYFNVTNIPDSDILKAAELSLSRRPIKDHKHKHHHQHHHPHKHSKHATVHQTVLVYDIVRPGVRGHSEPLFLLVDTQRVRITGRQTIKLDVQPAVERWLREPAANHGLLVHVAQAHDNRPAAHPHVRLRRSAATHADDADDADWSRHQPFLFAYTDDQRHRKRAISDAIASRKTRAAARRAGRQKMVREICQRRSLYVDFSNVGWSDWIVAPPGYDAYYCHGECHFPQADHLNSTNHAVVQALIHTVEPKMAPKVCCVPTQLNPISMLYLDDQNKVVLKNYQDMTVVGCGCR